jgi:hypothetical protein
MASKGRPALSKKLKKINFGFTAAPQLSGKLRKIKAAKSPFLAAICAAIPEAMIQSYNENPEKFLMDASGTTLILRRSGTSAKP